MTHKLCFFRVSVLLYVHGSFVRMVDDKALGRSSRSNESRWDVTLARGTGGRDINIGWIVIFEDRTSMC